MCNAFGGCISHLYKSVEKLDTEQFLKSCKHKEMLLSPKLAPDFSYETLSIEEDRHPPYYYESQIIHGVKVGVLKSDKPSTLIEGSLTLTVMDPKSHFKEAKSGGFLMGPSKFTITDNLIVTPIFPVSCMSLLNKLEVPLNDVKECVVHVGCEEEDKNDTWHRVERSRGRFSRRFRLPGNVKIDQIKASLENGVLTVTLPKHEVEKSDVKSIEITA
ncbi:hypothetical protein LWI28_014047 [Acer negundo]|uniref:SHSP domain-containing protein n=1 Tax=Acer negundo TaxID=4023 RepID=A0AAD5JE12_ACENE|nr:hypothetical protein LWI28_014047 [Acer negundo]